MTAKKIAENIYWLGQETDASLQCNPYLIVDKDEGVLIDPGSAVDFETVYKDTTNTIPLEKIKYVILSHQDPEIYSSTRLFEQNGLKAKIAAHSRAVMAQEFYGIKSEFYKVNEHNYQLKLSSGRKIHFISAPYMNFPGAIMTYDETSRVLFASDLFGSFATEWKLLTKKYYLETLKSFHDKYMPSNDILQPVMQSLIYLDIQVIAAQNGAVISKDVKKHLISFRDQACASMSIPAGNTVLTIINYRQICNKILKKLYSIFDRAEVISIFKDTNILLDQESGLIAGDSPAGPDLWDNIFQLIYAKKGLYWLTMIEPLSTILIKENNIEPPRIFRSIILNLEKKIDEIDQEHKKLIKLNKALEKNSIFIQQDNLKCPLTKLHNEKFFKYYLEKEVVSCIQKKLNSAILLIAIENIGALSIKYGDTTGDETLVKTAYLLNEKKESSQCIFKLTSAKFAYYAPDIRVEDTAELANDIRLAIINSSLFIEPLQVSIGVINLKELLHKYADTKELTSKLYATAKIRINMARKKGQNSICSESNLNENLEKQDTVLIVDDDEFNLEILKDQFIKENIKVFTCTDGVSALDIIHKYKPDLIISELMLPKIDGLRICAKLRECSELKNTPFILMSHLKDEKYIHSAISLNIDHYIKKPYYLFELLGIVKIQLQKIKEKAIH
ncbi:MAG: response regulator [bacterium]|nr:response regulator [bacterium]